MELTFCVPGRRTGTNKSGVPSVRAWTVRCRGSGEEAAWVGRVAILTKVAGTGLGEGFIGQTGDGRLSRGDVRQSRPQVGRQRWERPEAAAGLQGTGDSGRPLWLGQVGAGPCRTYSPLRDFIMIMTVKKSSVSVLGEYERYTNRE